MRSVINWLLALLLVSSTVSIFGQQDQGQQEPQGQQEQQTPPSQGQASSSAAVQSVTGCVVKSDQGYALKTESDTYPIDTDKDLSQYVNKQVKITGILEHHTSTASSSSAEKGSVISDIRLRMVASVVGDCNQAPK